MIGTDLAKVGEHIFEEIDDGLIMSLIEDGDLEEFCMALSIEIQSTTWLHD